MAKYTRRTTKKDVSKLIDLRRSMEYIKEVKSIVDDEFKIIKQKLINDFNNHKVTQEIEAGVKSSNTSNTLGGVGNLFSFIGFDSGDRPIEPIRMALDSISLTAVIISRDGSSRSSVIYPSADDIFRMTPMPWAEGRSWAQGIEQGMPGLGKFLRKDSGRSGGGLQADNKVRDGRFSNTPYISSLIKNFERNIQQLDKVTV